MEQTVNDDFESKFSNINSQLEQNTKFQFCELSGSIVVKNENGEGSGHVKLNDGRMIPFFVLNKKMNYITSDSKLETELMQHLEQQVNTMIKMEQERTLMFMNLIE